MLIADYIASARLADMIGIIGFCLYVTNYTLLTLGKLTSGGSAYFALNIGAASCVLIGLSSSFNMAAAMVQAFWIVASAWAVLLRWRHRRLARQPGDTPRLAA